jgi:hypothetical protein
VSAPKLLDRLHAKQAELLELERRSRARKPQPVAPAWSTPGEAEADRIRRLAATVTPAELSSARKRIKPTLQKSLSETDLHELALTLATAAKREKSRPRAENRPAREFYPRDVYQPEKEIYDQRRDAEFDRRSARREKIE